MVVCLFLVAANGEKRGESESFTKRPNRDLPKNSSDDGRTHCGETNCAELASSCTRVRSVRVGACTHSNSSSISFSPHSRACCLPHILCMEKFLFNFVIYSPFLLLPLPALPNTKDVSGAFFLPLKQKSSNVGGESGPNLLVFPSFRARKEKETKRVGLLSEPRRKKKLAAPLYLRSSLYFSPPAVSKGGRRKKANGARE